MTTNHPQPDDDRDLLQLTGAFDRPVAPSPAFADRLRRQVQSAQADALQPASPEPASDVAHVRLQEHEASTPRMPARLLSSRIMEIAAAVVLITAVAVAGFILSIQRSDDSTDMARLAAIGSPGSIRQSSAHAALLSGAYGPAWFFPDPAFDATSYDTVTCIEVPINMIPTSVQAYGHFLVQVGLVADAGDTSTYTPQLWVTDLRTRQVVWKQPGEFWPNFAIRGDTIFAMRTSEWGGDPREGGTLALVALIIETGAQRFEGFPIPMAGTDVSLRENWNAVSPVVIDDVVYVADTLGTTYAIDALHGTELWKTEGDRGTTRSPWSGGPGAAGGSLVADDEAIYVVTGANTIRKLDRDDGKILFDIEVAERLDQDVFGMTLYRDAENLVARIRTTGAQEDPTATEIEMRSETIASFGTETGNLRWKREYGDISGNIAVTADQVIVPSRHGPADGIAVDILNADDGFSNILLDTSFARTMAVTATGSNGRTIIMLDSNGDLQIGTLSDDFAFSINYRHEMREGVPGITQPTTAVITDGKAFTVIDRGTILAIEPQLTADNIPTSATPRSTP